jgi:zinc and cadmium transporter
MIMNVWSLTLLSVLAVSAVPLLGIALLRWEARQLERRVPYLVSFAVGALMGGALFHLLPEAVAELGAGGAFASSFLLGFFGFFVLEKSLWLHDHEAPTPGAARARPVATLNLVGDGIHNFVDGAIIAASYSISPSLGVATTVAVLLHELPQEIGDFGILIHAGLPVRRAILYNFLSALTALLGAILALLIGAVAQQWIVLLLPFAAGSFVYIAASDLIPELQRERSLPALAWQSLLILLGLVLLGGATLLG